MANYAKAYTIAFESNTHVSDIAIIPFLKKIENLMREQRQLVSRRINGKFMRVHAYEWNDMNDDFVVIPFGKLKEKNKPYGMDNVTQKLIDLPDNMFDVNSLVYHARYKIALITTNQLGPSENDIEQYLNSFLPKNAEYRIRIVPIFINAGIEKVRNAVEARSVTFTLDLGRPLNDFYRGQVHENQNIDRSLHEFMNYSKQNLESKTFTITLGLGKAKRASLDKNALLELLDSINIDSNCIKEITVSYRDRPDEKIDVAKLKEASIIYRVFFDIKDSRLSAEYLKNNVEDKLRAERNKYFNQIEEYFGHVVHFDGGYEFVPIWDEGPAI